LRGRAVLPFLSLACAYPSPEPHATASRLSAAVPLRAACGPYKSSASGCSASCHDFVPELPDLLVAAVKKPRGIRAALRNHHACRASRKGQARLLDRGGATGGEAIVTARITAIQRAAHQAEGAPSAVQPGEATSFRAWHQSASNAPMETTYPRRRLRTPARWPRAPRASPGRGHRP